MRYIPLTQNEKSDALGVIGATDVDELFSDIPEEIRLKELLALPKPLAEPRLMELMEELAGANNGFKPGKSFIGAGAYVHNVPSAVDQLILRSELFTAYTPYQPEISQGTLMAIYEFQTYTAALLEMDIANASMYDGASSLAEAVVMAQRITKKNKMVVSNLVHPHWREVINTYTQHLGVEINIVDCIDAGNATLESIEALVDDSTAALVVQYPNFFGNVEDLKMIRDICDKTGALMIVAVAEPVALGLLAGPGRFGADISVGEGRSFGASVSYGGPGLGLFAANKKWARQLPGRLVGKTNDVDGKEGYVLTLATREQHIRRERATSNICSNQALCATSAAIHLSLLGKTGLKELARRNHSAMRYLAQEIGALDGYKLLHDKPFFNEAVVSVPVSPGAINEALEKEGVLGGLDISTMYPSLENAMLFCATEVHTKEDIDALINILAEFKQ